jgi:hypothetical protein
VVCKCGGWKCHFRRCGGASQVVCLCVCGGGGGRWVGGLVGQWVGVFSRGHRHSLTHSRLVGQWVGVFSRGHRHSLTHSLNLFFLSRAHARALSLSRARARTHTHSAKDRARMGSKAGDFFFLSRTGFGVPARKARTSCFFTFRKPINYGHESV